MMQIGPWILALDQQDNPVLDLDSVRLPSRPAIDPAGWDGRGGFRGSAVLSVAADRRRAIFRTYADAGGGSRFRAVFPPPP